jgi:hypothetical protein
MITGGSSMAAIIFKAPPQLGQCSRSTLKTRLSSRLSAAAQKRFTAAPIANDLRTRKPPGKAAP